MSTLSFSEWKKIHSSVNESIQDKIQNWISRTLGGKISRIDGIVSDLLSLEKDFAREWEKIQAEISGMEDQMKSEEIPSSEKDTLRKKIKAKNQEIEKLENLKNQRIKALTYKIRDYVEDNPRILKYWELKKAEAEVEIAEILYNLSKKLSNKGIGKELYDSYLDSKENLKKKREEVHSIVKNDSRDREKIEKSSKGEKTPSGEYERIPGVRELASMSFSSFTSEVGRRDKASLRKIKKVLVGRKNEALNDLRALRRIKSKELDSARQGQKQQILKKYNPRIYEVGEFIDRMREKINYIDDKLNN